MPSHMTLQFREASRPDDAMAGLARNALAIRRFPPAVTEFNVTSAGVYVLCVPKGNTYVFVPVAKARVKWSPDDQDEPVFTVTADGDELVMVSEPVSWPNTPFVNASVPVTVTTPLMFAPAALLIVRLLYVVPSTDCNALPVNSTVRLVSVRVVNAY